MKRTLTLLGLLLLVAGVAYADYSVPTSGGRMTLEDAFTRHVQVTPVNVGNPADIPAGANVGAVGCKAFVTNADKTQHFQWEMGREWLGADGDETCTDMIIEVDWLPLATKTSTNVYWVLNYIALAEGEVAGGTETVVIADMTGDLAQYQTEHTEFTIDCDDADNPLTHEDHVFFQITRDVSEDDYANTACVTAYEVIYQGDEIPEI